MNPAEPGWPALKRAVAEVLDLPAGAREAYLDGQFPDPTQRAEATRLLRACEQAAAIPFFDVSAAQFAAQILSEIDEQERGVPEAVRAALAGRYTIERELGRGGMATVYLARDERHGRLVALKLLYRDLLAGDGRSPATLFQREIQFAARLSHPHILPLYDSGAVGEILYYIVPYVDGETLWERLRRTDRLPLPDTLRLLRDVTRALGHAHRLGVVHRDVKPGNILLNQDGDALVADFGVAKALAAARDASGPPEPELPSGKFALNDTEDVAWVEYTDSAIIFGTPAYMAPEQVAGDRGIDHRADLYALGAVAYEVLTGTAPFAGRSRQEQLTAHLEEVPEPVSARQPDVPAALATLVDRLLSKRPGDRPRDAAEVLKVLDSVTAPDVAAARPAEADAVPSIADFPFVAKSGALKESAIREPLTNKHLGARSRLPETSRNIASPIAVESVGRMLHFGRTYRARLVGAVVVAIVGSVVWLAVPMDVRAPHESTIAVIPFENLSDDPDQAYLSDGIAEELRTKLGRLEGMRTAARASTIQAWSRSGGVRDVGRALGVAYILQGSVRRDGERIRIEANLIDASNSLRVWSSSYDEEFDRLYTIHEEISHAIATALRIRLNARSEHRAQPTGNPEARELYLKGRYFANQRTEESLVRAAEYFRGAVEIDPSYPQAYSGLADVELAPRAGRPSERFARAKEAASRALALDSTLGEAHVSMGWCVMWYDHDWVGAERHFLKAIELNPNYPWAHSWYSGYLSATGRVEDGLAAMRQAFDLDPLSPPFATHVGSHYLWLKRDSDAVRYFLKALEIAPDFYMAHWGLARVYVRQGRYADALAELNYEGGDHVGFHRAGLLGYTYALSGNAEQARRILDELHAKADRGEYVPPIDLSIIYIGLGEYKEALTWLEQTEADRGSRIFLCDPIFDPVRSDPRFLQLRQRLGLGPEQLGV